MHSLFWYCLGQKNHEKYVLRICDSVNVVVGLVVSSTVYLHNKELIEINIYLQSSLRYLIRQVLYVLIFI